MNIFKENELIALDCSSTSELNWSVPRKQALLAIAQGKKVLWQLDLGVFANLAKPLNNSAQFMTLGLAIDHFVSHIWKEFQGLSVGVCLYLGCPVFFHQFQWDEEQIKNFQIWLEEGFSDIDHLVKESQTAFESFSTVLPHHFSNPLIPMLFCQDVCSDYLMQLSGRLPDGIPQYLIFKAQAVQDPWLLSLLTAKERFEHVEVLINDGPFIEDKTASTGICLPSIAMRKPSQYIALKEAFEFLIRNEIPFRIISESHLTSEWDGLDHLIYTSSGLSLSGRRKFLGFNAANGTLVAIDEKKGFPIEISFEEYKTLVDK